MSKKESALKLANILGYTDVDYRCDWNEWSVFYAVSIITMNQIATVGPPKYILVDNNDISRFATREESREICRTINRLYSEEQ
ncbi:MAG: hypothetical protein K6B74_07690 [Ruminococcus sp.]|nr:hypothetical protein [Ruminococcus sp.]